MFEKIKEKFIKAYFYGSLVAIYTTLPQKAFAQLSATNSLTNTLTGSGWIPMVIQISIVVVALMEIMKELPDLLSGTGVWPKLAKIAAWVAIAIWWDDILKALLAGSVSQTIQ